MKKNVLISTMLTLFLGLSSTAFCRDSVTILQDFNINLKHGLSDSMRVEFDFNKNLSTSDISDLDCNYFNSSLSGLAVEGMLYHLSAKFESGFFSRALLTINVYEGDSDSLVRSFNVRDLEVKLKPQTYLRKGDLKDIQRFALKNDLVEDLATAYRQVLYNPARSSNISLDNSLRVPFPASHLMLDVVLPDDFRNYLIELRNSDPYPEALIDTSGYSNFFNNIPADPFTNLNIQTKNSVLSNRSENSFVFNFHTMGVGAPRKSVVSNLPSLYEKSYDEARNLICN